MTWSAAAEECCKINMSLPIVPVISGELNMMAELYDFVEKYCEDIFKSYICWPIKIGLQFFQKKLHFKLRTFLRLFLVIGSDREVKKLWLAGSNRTGTLWWCGWNSSYLRPRKISTPFPPTELKFGPNTCILFHHATQSLLRWPCAAKQNVLCMVR